MAAHPFFLPAGDHRFFLQVGDLRLAGHIEQSSWNPIDFIVSEGATLAAVLLAAWLMMKIERHRWSFEDYGISLRSYRSLFLQGVIWGFLAPTVLVVLLWLAGGASFEGLALHGKTLALFTILWALGMLGVGLTEDPSRH